MNHTMTTGRWIGAAMLTSFGVGMLSNFGLQQHLFANAGFLVNAAAQPGPIGLIILLGLFTSLLSVWVGVTLHGHFGPRHPRLAGMLLALAVAGMGATLLEMATLNLMRSLSELYLSTGAQAGPPADTLKAIVRGLRDGIHFPDKLLGGASVFAFSLLLFRSRALPRLLAALGMLAALLQMGSVSLPLFGQAVVYPLLAPLALSYVSMGLWLLFKGFAAERLPLNP